MIKETLRIFSFVIISLAVMAIAMYFFFWGCIAILGIVVWFGMLVGKYVFGSLVIVGFLLWMSYEIAKSKLKAKR